ncbi:hypothetical protein ABID08_005568 [Rhizobium binae]|uniref:Uncharacterized protein n=1 Tax=Rhizobium binae TaxID=1138190 RepID=A0ABV2MP54_9HYPH
MSTEDFSPSAVSLPYVSSIRRPRQAAEAVDTSFRGRQPQAGKLQHLLGLRIGIDARFDLAVDYQQGEAALGFILLKDLGPTEMAKRFFSLPQDAPDGGAGPHIICARNS